jgi:hypothetical protein
MGDLLLILFCYKGTQEWDERSHSLAMQSLFLWMFVSKFIKLLGHYIRYPADFVLLPVSVLFGYFHGGIKLYAACTLNVVSLRTTVPLPAFSCQGSLHAQSSRSTPLDGGLAHCPTRYLLPTVVLFDGPSLKAWMRPELLLLAVHRDLFRS